MQNNSAQETRIAAHETRDLSIRGVVIFAIGLLATLALTLVLLARLFHYFQSRQSLGPPASPFANTRTLPPAPRLQVRPREDLGELSRGEQTLLHSYGWVDQKQGIVRIPIDRAMDLLLQRGLPVRQQAPAQPSPPGKK